MIGVYTKKPVTIKAIKYDGSYESFEEIQKFVGENFIPYTMDDDHRSVGIKTLEGIMIASVGDYIIRGIAGEFYPCKPEIFKATYDFLLYSPE